MALKGIMLNEIKNSLQRSHGIFTHVHNFLKMTNYEVENKVVVSQVWNDRSKYNFKGRSHWRFLWRWKSLITQTITGVSTYNKMPENKTYTLNQCQFPSPDIMSHKLQPLRETAWRLTEFLCNTYVTFPINSLIFQSLNFKKVNDICQLLLCYINKKLWYDILSIALFC